MWIGIVCFDASGSGRIRIGIKVADLVERLRVLFSKLEFLCVQIKEDERKERQEQERVKREQKRAADKARREAAAAEAALNRYGYPLPYQYES
jgi:hypothetical protein